MFVSCLYKYTYVFTCVFIYVNMCVGTCLHPEDMCSVSPSLHICLHDYARYSILKIKCPKPTATVFFFFLMKTEFEQGLQLFVVVLVLFVCFVSVFFTFVLFSVRES